MQCTRAKAGGVCCVASTLVIIGIVLFLTKWMNGDTTTIDNDGDNNKGAQDPGLRITKV